MQRIVGKIDYPKRPEPPKPPEPPKFVYKIPRQPDSARLFTPEEDQIIRDLWPHKSGTEIGVILKRARGSIIKRARKMGVKKATAQP